MYPFVSLELAARYAMRCRGPAFVFDGPGGSGPEFIVAMGREARGLIEDGHEPYDLWETALAARGQPLRQRKRA